jgi:hypothetical protein
MMHDSAEEGERMIERASYCQNPALGRLGMAEDTLTRLIQPLGIGVVLPEPWAWALRGNSSEYGEFLRQKFSQCTSLTGSAGSTDSLKCFSFSFSTQKIGFQSRTYLASMPSFIK